MEKWLDINGYPNYEISDKGFIRNKSNGFVRKKVKCKDGYERVNLFKDGVRKSFTVHKLVACAFLENPESKQTVNHINGNKSDNRLENLEWSTYSEQMQHAVKKGLINEKTYKRAVNIMKEKNKVKVVRLNDGKIFDSIQEAADSIGLSRTSISRCVRGLDKSAGKDENGNPLRWKYM